MPKVSDSHREARRDQVVHAATQVIARGGFAGLTMADVIRESGLSAGAVYTYFTSKAEIVDAVVADTISGVLSVFERELADGAIPDLPDLLEAITSYVIGAGEGARAQDRSVVMLQVMAHAVLSGEDDVTMRQRTVGFLDGWREAVRRLQRAGKLPAIAEPESMARVLMSMVPGFVLQRRLIGGDVTPATYANGLRALLGATTPAPGAAAQ